MFAGSDARQDLPSHQAELNTRRQKMLVMLGTDGREAALEILEAVLDARARIFEVEGIFARRCLEYRAPRCRPC
jgi:hypothetical protein